jgi:hypothetical protein
MVSYIIERMWAAEFRQQGVGEKHLRELHDSLSLLDIREIFLMLLRDIFGAYIRKVDTE